MVTMISVWCVSTPVWWPGEDAGEERGLRNCCRVLLGLVTEPWPANDGRNDGANLSCIYHVSIMYLSWRWYTPAGAGAAPLTLLQPRPDLTTSEVHSILLHWLQSEDAMKYINIFSEKLWASISILQRVRWNQCEISSFFEYDLVVCM